MKYVKFLNMLIVKASEYKKASIDRFTLKMLNHSYHTSIFINCERGLACFRSIIVSIVSTGYFVKHGRTKVCLLHTYNLWLSCQTTAVVIMF